MKKIITSVILVFGLSANVLGQAFTENFDNITTLTTTGWFQQNNSAPIGSNPNWFQGNPISGGGPFDAFNGASNAYIACNFNSTAGTGTINNWLVSPNRTFKNGDVITFYTRKTTITAGQVDYPDRIELRLSTNGASTNVGVGATAVGDFTTLLLSVNPTLVVGVYPQIWTQYTATISGLPAPTSGRFAFRYFVTNGGPTGANSDYIGLDNVVYTPYVCPTFTMTSGGALSGTTAGTAYSTQLTQTGALGAPNFAITAGALPSGLSMNSNGLISGTATATGTFNFTVTVSDASGCSGSQSYSITSVCPANPIVFSTSPNLCNNGPDYQLVEGTPAGGTYSGTGVTSGSFDPSLGTNTVTYDYTDTYGCAYNSSYTISVNTAPVVSHTTVPSICSNNGVLNLTGGSPLGGVYSGSGISGNTFDPVAGTQQITYSFTDANGCSNANAFTITVNTAPVVSHTAVPAICSNNGVLNLTGGAPLGGVYSGSGVSGNTFDPVAGTQQITYTFTDANGCSNANAFTVTVNQEPSVLHSNVSPLCSNDAPLSLSGGNPAGGVYSGSGVSANTFDPAAGTQTILYTYTDANGCTGSVPVQMVVNPSPIVSFTANPNFLCTYSSVQTLSGSPAGGTFSGNGVTGSQFDPNAAGIGNQVIVYSYTDANGCSNESSDTITVDACLGLGSEDIVAFGIYPNPGNAEFFFSTPEMIEEFQIIDVNGRLVPYKKIPNGFSIVNVESGVYYAIITTEKNTITTRFVKQ
jgi:hypothetical protein